MNQSPEVYRQEFNGESADYTQAINVSFFSSCRQQEQDQVPSPQKPRFGYISNEEEFDEKQKMILNSIIRRWKFSVIKDQVIEKTLLDLERDLDEQQKELLPKVLEKVRSNDKNIFQQFVRHTVESPEQIQDPQEFGAKEELKAYKDKLSQSQQSAQQLRIRAMSLETKVIELENQLEKERDKSNTMELELNKINESQIQYDMLADVRKNYEDNIRLKSEDWEVQKNDIKQHYEREINNMNQLCQKMAKEHEKQITQLKDIIIDYRIKVDRLQVETGILNHDLEQTRKQVQQYEMKNTQSQVYLVETRALKDDLLKKVDELQEQLQKTKCSLVQKLNIQSKVQSLQQKIEKLNRVNKQLQQQLREQQLKNQQGEIQQINSSRFQAFQSQMQAEKALLIQKNNAFQKRLSESNEKILSYKAKVQKYKGQRQKWRTKYNNKVTELNQLQQQMLKLIECQEEQNKQREKQNTILQQLNKCYQNKIRQENQHKAEIKSLQLQLQASNQSIHMMNTSMMKSHSQGDVNQNKSKLEKCFDMLLQFKATSSKSSLQKLRQRLSVVLSDA